MIRKDREERKNKNIEGNNKRQTKNKNNGKRKRKRKNKNNEGSNNKQRKYRHKNNRVRKNKNNEATTRTTTSTTKEFLRVLINDNLYTLFFRNLDGISLLRLAQTNRSCQKRVVEYIEPKVLNFIKKVSKAKVRNYMSGYEWDLHVEHLNFAEWLSLKSMPAEEVMAKPNSIWISLANTEFARIVKTGTLNWEELENKTAFDTRLLKKFQCAKKIKSVSEQWLHIFLNCFNENAKCYVLKGSEDTDDAQTIEYYGQMIFTPSILCIFWGKRFSDFLSAMMYHKLQI